MPEEFTEDFVDGLRVMIEHAIEQLESKKPVGELPVADAVAVKVHDFKIMLVLLRKVIEDADELQQMRNRTAALDLLPHRLRMEMEGLIDQMGKRHWFNVIGRMGEMQKEVMRELRIDLNPEES